jgi:hypothetical protein
MIENTDKRHAGCVPAKDGTAAPVEKIYRSFMAHISPIRTDMRSFMAYIYGLCAMLPKFIVKIWNKKHWKMGRNGLTKKDRELYIINSILAFGGKNGKI